MGSRRLAGGAQSAWLLRGTLSRSALPAARRSARERKTGTSSALLTSVLAFSGVFLTVAMVGPPSY